LERLGVTPEWIENDPAFSALFAGRTR
jgi:hypothetical protein